MASLGGFLEVLKSLIEKVDVNIEEHNSINACCIWW
jgi:hypothetical protein